MNNTLNLNGSVLTLASLALIAEMLERGGEIVVRNCAVQSDAPVAKSLGFEVFREEQDGYWHTHIEETEPRKTAMEFWTPVAATVAPCARCGTTNDALSVRWLDPTLCRQCYCSLLPMETPAEPKEGTPA